MLNVVVLLRWWCGGGVVVGDGGRIATMVDRGGGVEVWCYVVVGV